MTKLEQAQEVIRNLASNAAQIKAGIKEGNLQDSAKLVGDRVALVEALRELWDAKVSFANSDIKNEMSSLVQNMENDVSEAIGNISTNTSALLKELAKMRGAKNIAAYKIQGDRHGY